MEDYGGGGYVSSKRCGKIPAFGHWEYADDLPITQYFESARQAGLLNRYSSSSGECGGGCSDDRNNNVRGYNKGDGPRRHARGSGDTTARKVPTRHTDRQKQRSCPQVTGSDHLPKKKPAVLKPTNRHVTPRVNNGTHDHNDVDAVSTYPRPTTMPVRAARGNAKPVDEDLYKIPPELLHTTKRKKMPGFFSRCLVPGCSA